MSDSVIAAYLHALRSSSCASKPRNGLADLRATNPSAKLADAQFAHRARARIRQLAQAGRSRVDGRSATDRQPQITAPVSRCLGARETSIAPYAFWQDVLGFEVAERARRRHHRSCDFGPRADSFRRARLPARFLGRGTAHRDRPSCSSTPTTSKACTRPFASRGGQPSELEKVNWIKRRVFEVRDPDGHTSSGSASPTTASRPLARARMMSRIMPELPFGRCARRSESLPRCPRLQRQLRAGRHRRAGSRRCARCS